MVKALVLTVALLGSTPVFSANQPIIHCQIDSLTDDGKAVLVCPSTAIYAPLHAYLFLAPSAPLDPTWLHRPVEIRGSGKAGLIEVHLEKDWKEIKIERVTLSEEK